MNKDETGTGDGRSSSGKASRIGGWVRPILFLALLGSATYAVSLAASVPASLVAAQVELPGEIIDVSGTIWNGQAILRGGYELKWKVLPLRSLLHVAFDADWTLSGLDTRLAGQVSAWTTSATTSMDGRAGWGLVRMAAPDLALSCDGSIAVALSRVVLSRERQGAAGSLRSGPTRCRNGPSEAGVPIEVPALSGTATLSAGGSRLAVVASAAPTVPLADLRVAGRVLEATVHPAGARIVGSLPTTGPITIEFPF